MIMHWPGGLSDAAGTKRGQFASVSDVAPTIYELLGVEAPDVYRGVEQMPVTGHSFATVLRDADAPPVNTLQYFENAGSRALIAEHDGVWWKAVTKHNQGDDFDAEPWELYDLSADPSECENLADANPEKLAELVELWWQEAESNGDHSPHRLDRTYSYRPPMSPIPSQASASVGGRAFDLTARVTLAAGDEGAIWATGNENSGMSVFVQNGRLVADYNSFNDHTIVESTVPVPEGECTLSVHLERDSRTTGWVEVSIDGEPCGRGDIGFYMRMISSVGSSVGMDHGSAVSERYAAPFAFTGTLHEVTAELPSRKQADVAADASSTTASEMSRQ
jgi:arylsulfatase